MIPDWMRASPTTSPPPTTSRTLTPGLDKRVNRWYIIEHTDSGGLKFSTVFPDLKEEEDKPFTHAVAAIAADSDLYVLGGHLQEHRYLPLHFGESKSVRCVDIGNYQLEGWRTCKPLEVGVDNFYTHSFLHGSAPQADNYSCYIYDTTTQEGFYIENPLYIFDPSYRLRPDICVPLEGRGMMVIDLHKSAFFVHDPDQNSWDRCSAYELLPTDLGNSMFILQSDLDGILYLCDTRQFPCLTLYAYDCWIGTLIYEIDLPQLCKPSPCCVDADDVDYYRDCYCPIHMVAVSESKLCLFWNYARRLFCAQVFVPLAPHPTPEVLEVRHFRIGDQFGITLENCLAVDACLGPMAKVSTLMDQTSEEPKQNIPYLRRGSMKLTAKPVTRPCLRLHPLS